MNSAREQVLPPCPKRGSSHPVADCCSGLFSNFELDGPARLPLDHGGAVANMPSHTYVVDSQPHEIAAAQLAIDREIEQGEIAAMLFKLQSDPDGPDLLWFQRTFLTDEAALVPRGFRKTSR